MPNLPNQSFLPYNHQETDSILVPLVSNQALIIRAMFYARLQNFTRRLVPEIHRIELVARFGQPPTPQPLPSRSLDYARYLVDIIV